MYLEGRQKTCTGRDTFWQEKKSDTTVAVDGEGEQFEAVERNGVEKVE